MSARRLRSAPVRFEFNRNKSVIPNYIGSLTKDVIVPEASPDQAEQAFDSGVFTMQFKVEEKRGD